MPNYLLPALIALYVAWRVFTAWQAKRQVPVLLAQGAQAIDVRSAAEFAAGHSKRAKNIPLPEIGQRLAELDKRKWVIVCCATGTRSGMARRVLLKNGFTNVLNAGSWRNLPE